MQILILLAFFVLLGRSFWLQVIWIWQLKRIPESKQNANDKIVLSLLEIYQGADSSASGSSSQWHHKITRGYIYDRKGLPLAAQVQANSLYADPWRLNELHQKARKSLKSNKRRAEARKRLLWTDVNILSNKLAAILEVSPDDIKDRLSRKERSGIPIKRNLTLSQTNAIQSLIKNLGHHQAIYIIRETTRYYPEGNIGSNFIGFVGKDNEPKEGLEKFCNPTLTGKRLPTDSLPLEYHDDESLLEQQPSSSNPSPISPPNKRAPTTRGYSLILTIDFRLQQLAEQILKTTVRRWAALGGCCIIVEVKSGEILAMANYPGFDPKLSKLLPQVYRVNRAAYDLVEPGSAFKPIVVAMALQEGLVSPTQTFYCPGSIRVGSHTIRCAVHSEAACKRGHGYISTEEAVALSCNVSLSKIGLKIPPHIFYKYIKEFGFLEPSLLPLPYQAKSKIKPPQLWEAIYRANLSFGQGIAITPLQLTYAYAAIANGGLLMYPMLVKAIIDEEGKPVIEYQPRARRQAVSAAVSEELMQMLKLAVKEGTGKTAKVAGYEVAGKTGTAQKPVPGIGFNSGKYIASFYGIIPADERSPVKLVIAVVIDEPKASYWGATVAAPAFKELAAQAMWQLGIPPDKPIDTNKMLPIQRAATTSATTAAASTSIIAAAHNSR